MIGNIGSQQLPYITIYRGLPMKNEIKDAHGKGPVMLKKMSIIEKKEPL